MMRTILPTYYLDFKHEFLSDSAASYQWSRDLISLRSIVDVVVDHLNWEQVLVDASLFLSVVNFKNLLCISYNIFN